MIITLNNSMKQDLNSMKQEISLLEKYFINLELKGIFVVSTDIKY